MLIPPEGPVLDRLSPPEPAGSEQLSLVMPRNIKHLERCFIFLFWTLIIVVAEFNS